MTNFESGEVVEAILEMRDLLRLLAEPAIAERDQKLREEVRKIVGASLPKAKAVLSMDGTRTQLSVHQELGIHKGQLSTLVKDLTNAGLIVGDPRHPKLRILLPTNFFERGK